MAKATQKRKRHYCEGDDERSDTKQWISIKKTRKLQIPRTLDADTHSADTSDEDPFSSGTSDNEIIGLGWDDEEHSREIWEEERSQEEEERNQEEEDERSQEEEERNQEEEDECSRDIWEEERSQEEEERSREIWEEERSQEEEERNQEEEDERSREIWEEERSQEEEERNQEEEDERSREIWEEERSQEEEDERSREIWEEERSQEEERNQEEEDERSREIWEEERSQEEEERNQEEEDERSREIWEEERSQEEEERNHEEEDERSRDIWEGECSQEEEERNPEEEDERSREIWEEEPSQEEEERSQEEEEERNQEEEDERSREIWEEEPSQEEEDERSREIWEEEPSQEEEDERSREIWEEERSREEVDERSQEEVDERCREIWEEERSQEEEDERSREEEDERTRENWDEDGHSSGTSAGVLPSPVYWSEYASGTSVTQPVPAFGSSAPAVAPAFGASTDGQTASLFGASTQKTNTPVFGASTSNNSNIPVFDSTTNVAPGFNKSHSTPAFGTEEGRSPSPRLEIVKRGDFENKTTLSFKLTEEEVLGKGTSADVFKGTYRGRAVAVKRILDTSPTTQEGMNRELSILNDMEKRRHPNIVGFYLAEFCKPYLYLVLELCDGTLKDYVHQDKQHWRDALPPSQVNRNMAEGLKYLHSQNIVHRDLKPCNVLFRLDGNNICKVYLADFGMAKHTQEGAFSVSGAFGTLSYLAAEVWDSDNGCVKDGKFNNYSDIFSMGILFCYCLTGIHPFRSQENISKGNTMLEQLYEVDHASGTLVEAMLDPNPNKRPDIAKVLQHPALWTEKEVMHFFNMISDALENESDGIRDRIRHNKLISNGVWMPNLPLHFRNYLQTWTCPGQKRCYYQGHHSSAYYLLRAIRNTNHHHLKYSDDVKGELGTFPAGHLKVWKRCSPTLLVHMYKVLPDLGMIWDNEEKQIRKIKTGQKS